MKQLDQHQYYRKQCIHLMNELEKLVYKTMSETNYADIEKDFWKYSDTNDLKGLKKVHNKLTNIIDDLTMD